MTRLISESVLYEAHQLLAKRCDIYIKQEKNRTNYCFDSSQRSLSTFAIRAKAIPKSNKLYRKSLGMVFGTIKVKR